MKSFSLADCDVSGWSFQTKCILRYYGGHDAQDPTSFTESYTAPATLITDSCKVARNTTDGWSKLLYSAGDPVVYASRKDFVDAMMNGSQTGIWTPSVRSAPSCAPLTQ